MDCSSSKGKSSKQGLFKSCALAFSVVFGLSSGAVAQSDNTITLLYEGEDGVSGELLEYDGQRYRLLSSIGRVTVPAEGLTCIGAACPEGTRLEPTLPLVTLVSADGSATVQGNLIDVTDTEYVLATNLGEFRIKSDSVTCEGEGCPEEKGQLPAVGIVVLSDGSTSIEGTLIGLDSTDFVLQSEMLGVVRLSRATFQCKGEVCP